MIQMALGVEGMACGMCEAHINEAVRNAFLQKNLWLRGYRGVFEATNFIRKVVRPGDLCYNTIVRRNLREGA